MCECSTCVHSCLCLSEAFLCSAALREDGINQAMNMLSAALCSLVTHNAWPGVTIAIVIKVWKEVWAGGISFKSHPGLESDSSASQVSSHLR